MEQYYVLSNELKERLASALNGIINAIKNLYEKLEIVAKAICNAFNTYLKNIVKMDPRKRYKYLKSIGVKDYVPFFNRNGIYHCRNNC